TIVRARRSGCDRRALGYSPGNALVAELGDPARRLQAREPTDTHDDCFMAPPKVYKNFIDGEWVESNSGNAFENLNPANRHELVGMFQKSNAQDVDLAVAAAKEAYKSWRLVPAPKRGEILYRAARLL